MKSSNDISKYCFGGLFGFLLILAFLRTSAIAQTFSNDYLSADGSNIENTGIIHRKRSRQMSTLKLLVRD